MKKFEAIVLLSPDLNNQNIDKEEKFFIKNIEDSEGKIIAQENWGLKDLSFNINNFKKAYYKFFQIEIEGSKIQNIRKIIGQNEKILRHLFVNVKEHQTLPTKMINNEER